MRVDWTSQDGQIDPFWTLWMTSVIDSEEETIFTNRITAGSASRVRNATRLIYQPQRRSSKLREFHIMLQVTFPHRSICPIHRLELRINREQRGASASPGAQRFQSQSERGK